MAENENKENVSRSTAKKAVIKRKKYKVFRLGKNIFYYKNKSGRLSWMPIPMGKIVEVGDEIEI